MKVLAAVLFLGASLAQATSLDNFNRPDAPTLGPNWTVQAGGAEIFNHRARGLNVSQFANLVTYNGVSSNSAAVDAFSVDSSLAYVALVVAFQDASNNYFVKVMNQGGGASGFNYVAFYYGNNGSGSFFHLNSPFTSGRLTVSYTGTTVTLKIDTDFDGDADPNQTYIHKYSIATAGKGIGLGFYGTAQADNFGTAATTPEPSSLLLVGTGLSLLVGVARRRKK